MWPLRHSHVASHVYMGPTHHGFCLWLHSMPLCPHQAPFHLSLSLIHLFRLVMSAGGRCQTFRRLYSIICTPRSTKRNYIQYFLNVFLQQKFMIKLSLFLTTFLPHTHIKPNPTATIFSSQEYTPSHNSPHYVCCVIPG